MVQPNTLQYPYELQPVLTFSDLRQVVTRKSPNQIIVVICGSVLNDGYGGIFSYDFNSVAADDDNNIIAPTSNIGRWIRINTSGSGGGFNLSGDVTGPISNNTVSKLQGNTLDIETPNNNDVITWNAALNKWISAPVPGSGSLVPTEVGQILYSASNNPYEFTVERPLINDEALIMVNNDDEIVVRGDI